MATSFSIKSSVYFSLLSVFAFNIPWNVEMIAMERQTSDMFKYHGRMDPTCKQGFADFKRNLEAFVELMS